MISAVRGMRDVFGAELAAWQRAEAALAASANGFGYHEFRTPLVEHIDLFQRGVGEFTDIVGKEMYVFEDRGGDRLALRPEMTAPIVRASIEHSLVRHTPATRLWYMGPLFRYERPQKGRQRQFHQFGAELLGSPHPEADAEIICLAHDAMQHAGVRGLQLNINTLGSAETRHAYRTELVQYLRRHSTHLSADSGRRLETNPLRILDSKDSADQDIIRNAPVLFDYLSDADADHFAAVCAILESSGITIEVCKTLVRGLDYYSHTVFEFTSLQLGAQNTVCGGGRYDQLFSMLGGGTTPAVGFSVGMERLMLLLEAQEGGFTTLPPTDVYCIALSETARLPVQLIALRLRRAGFTVVTDVLRRSAKAQFRDADKMPALCAVIIGDDELAAGVALVKNLKTSEQVSVPNAELPAHLAGLLDRVP